MIGTIEETDNPRVSFAIECTGLLASIGFKNNGTSSGETAASDLCKIASSLVGGLVVLSKSGNAYCVAAVTRQLVEIEYLSYAVAHGHRAVEDWANSTHRERLNQFSPRHLYTIEGSSFSREDYQDHCEIGGHPTPRGVFLTSLDKARCEELFIEALIHVNSIMRNIHEWIAKNRPQRDSGEVEAWNQLSNQARELFTGDDALARLRQRFQAWDADGRPR